MAIALLTHTANSGGSGGVTTSAIDTTGANLIVVAFSYGNGLTATLSDSKSNTWILLTAANQNDTHRLAYCLNPIVGTGHTFTIGTGPSLFSPIAVSAFSGVNAFVTEVGSTTTGVTTIQPGNITTVTDGTLVIASLGWYNAGTPASIASPFTISDQEPYIGGTSYPIALAYYLQTTRASVNPTWTLSASGNPVAWMATFSPLVPTFGNFISLC